MSTAAATLVAPPFSRPQADSPVAWVAGLAFGLVCIVAAVVFVVAYALMALGRAVARSASLGVAQLRSAAVPLPVPLPASPHS